jgi:hypothetical protein
MRPDMTRRDFIKQTAALGAVAAVGWDNAAGAEQAGKGIGRIKLGDLEVSRFILGSNAFLGYANRPGDFGRQMTEYFRTDERIVAVLEEAAGLGITAVAAPPYDRWTRLWSKYQEGGGKLKIWLAQMDGDPGKMKDDISAAVKAGAKAVFIQGRRVDDQFDKKALDAVRGWVEHIKTLNLPAGMATHRPDVHLEAQKQKFPVDFFWQCFYIPEKYLSEDRDNAVKALVQLEKPVIAYKIMAAGTKDPEEAFRFAFRHLRKTDGVCVGVFPKDDPDQLKRDVALFQKHSGAASQPAP